MYLTNPNVGHAAAFNVPCSIGNFKRRAFVPQMSNMAEIIAVLFKALSNMQKDTYVYNVHYGGKRRAVILSMFVSASD